MGVWIPTMDVAPAKEFGELVVLLPSGLSFLNMDEILPTMEGKLDGFDFHNDFLLPLADPVTMIAAALTVANAIYQGNVREEQVHMNVLRWDRRQARYFATKIPL